MILQGEIWWWSQFSTVQVEVNWPAPLTLCFLVAEDQTLAFVRPQTLNTYLNDFCALSKSFNLPKFSLESMGILNSQSYLALTLRYSHWPSCALGEFNEHSSTLSSLVWAIQWGAEIAVVDLRNSFSLGLGTLIILQRRLEPQGRKCYFHSNINTLLPFFTSSSHLWLP